MIKLLVTRFLAYAAKLRFPTLFKLTAILFALNLLVPDFIPFIDEILLGLGTALLASWKARRNPDKPDDAAG
ncbi:MAG: DUF6116 family protein [Arenimonas sp.]